MNKRRYKTFNPEVRKWQDINLDDMQPGQTVIEMLWANSLPGWVTIPGACQYIVGTDKQLQLVKEEE